MACNCWPQRWQRILRAWLALLLRKALASKPAHLRQLSPDRRERSGSTFLRITETRGAFLHP